MLAGLWREKLAMRIPAALERYLPARKPVLRFGRGPVVVVTWDQSAIYFLVAEKRGEAVRASRRGKLVRREEQDPLLTLGEYLRTEAIDAKASPRNPRVATDSRPSRSLIFEVA